jgi:23S rRNA (pseudouridine1915-N3)-methyltransferase
LLRHTGKNPDCAARVANRASVQIRVVAVGKLKAPYAVQACAEFAKRLGPYYPLEIVEVKASDGSLPLQAMREEAERIGKHLHNDDCVWLLDRGGEQLSSEQLSRMIAGVANAGTRRMAFVIAGTYGAGQSLRERADFVWSLSNLTFLHEWARMIVVEQIYRAAKIARNEPYHH